MQAYHSFDFGGAIQIGHAVRVMCVSGNAETPLYGRLAALGGSIETEAELYAALSSVIDDPNGCDLLVLDCDSLGTANSTLSGTLGGDEVIETAKRTLRAVKSRVQVVLISAAFPTHVFPESREEPIRLRAPVSDLSLRIGYEHALRDMILWEAA